MMENKQNKIKIILDSIEKNNLNLEVVEQKLCDFSDISNVQKKINQAISYMILKYPLQIGIIATVYNKHSQKNNTDSTNNLFILSEILVFCKYAKNNASFSTMLHLWEKILRIN